ADRHHPDPRSPSLPYTTLFRSQIHSRAGSTTILDVVPEGTFVNEGDIVVELDASSLRLEENAQEILVSTRESLVSEAENTLKARSEEHTSELQSRADIVGRPRL